METVLGQTNVLAAGMFVWKWLRKYENDEKCYFNIVKRPKYCKPRKESEFNFQNIIGPHSKVWREKM